MRQIQRSFELVYFIADPVKDVVKIGYSKEPERRLKQLQTSNSSSLLLLGYIEGNKDKEKYLHQLFEKYKQVGEWFSLEEAIVNYINENNLRYCHVEKIDGKVYRLNKMPK